MSTLEALHRDPIHRSGAHVLALPGWLPPVRQKNALATYWHKPRSASIDKRGVITVHLWCGQVRYIAAAELAAIGAPPTDLKCGTCVGRRLGFDRADGHIFQPRDHWALPRRCPSTSPDPNDYRLCLACGRRTNAARAPFGWGLAQHVPGPELAARYTPCSRHGWAKMRLEWDHETRRETGRLNCSVFSCAHVSERACP